MGAASISTLMQRLNSTTTRNTPRVAASVSVSSCCVRVAIEPLEQEVVGVQRRLGHAVQRDVIAATQVDDRVSKSIIDRRRLHVGETVEARDRLQIDDVVAAGACRKVGDEF